MRRIARIRARRHEPDHCSTWSAGQRHQTPVRKSCLL